MTASRIISTINLQSDRFLIGHVLGKAPLGQYTLGSDIASMVTYSIAGPIMQATFAGFSKLQEWPDRLRAAYLRCQQMLVIVLLPMGCGLAVLADRLVPLVLGQQWSDAIIVILWLAPVVSLQSLYMPLLSLAMAVGQPRLLVQREALNLSIRLPATLLGAFFYGLVGAVIARAVCGVVIILLTLLMANRYVQLSIWDQLANIWRSIVSVVAMVITMQLLMYAWPPLVGVLYQWMQLIAFVAAGGVVFVGLHLLLWLLVGRPDGAESFAMDLLRQKAD